MASIWNTALAAIGCARNLMQVAIAMTSIDHCQSFLTIPGNNEYFNIKMCHMGNIQMYARYMASVGLST